MNVRIEKYAEEDLPAMLAIWNEVVNAGQAFPQEEPETPESGKKFFAGQSHCAVARAGDEIVGLYILHPNNVGRCGHICNASYAVKSDLRGQGIGEKLVKDSLMQAKTLGFGIMQFNAVACDNGAANHLYQRLGFQPLGRIPGGFRRPDGTMVDINLYYFQL